MPGTHQPVVTQAGELRGQSVSACNLAPQGAGYVYRAPGLKVQLDAALKPQGEPEVSAPEGATLGLVPAAMLATLLRGIAPEQLPAVAE